MFVQIHMLQSMPPGNLNRDDTGQPKKCIFGGATRGRISSQCLKRNIRKYLADASGYSVAVGTTYLPRMVADETRKLKPDITDQELNKIKRALASKFKAEKRGRRDDADETSEEPSQRQGASASAEETDQTGQRVVFPEPFARQIAELVTTLMTEKKTVYEAWLTPKKAKKKTRSPEEKSTDNATEDFDKELFKISQSLTVDIGMFGRMTTSDLVVNVEAACQVAHAISTHEVVIESDYFSAMDDKKADLAPTQAERAGAAFIGSGETETFFNSAVYYKYLNLDVDALKKHLRWQDEQAAKAVGQLLLAAARATPTGKQNSFASHGIPELILAEVSRAKCPISYANAFLKPVEGTDLMSQSAKALAWYIDAAARAFAPADLRRTLLAVGPASVAIEGSTPAYTLDDLARSVEEIVKKGDGA